tara:strand:- start:147 stop:800 length:654 start_codon:yes stop_codon:yes gene_type:complete
LKKFIQIFILIKLKINYKYHILKSLADYFFAILILFLSSPIFIIIYILIRFNLGKPVFFKQLRPGLNGKVFNLIKFRTMTFKKDKYGNLLDDNYRLNSLGNFLRKTSIDELPSLINVLKGEMSIIGPRPLLVEYLNFYSDEQHKRHLVKPGLTGFAQINGRNAISWEEKFQYDIFYVENISFLLDIKIFFLTILTLIKRNGINTKDGKFMPRFKGSK